VRWPNLAKPSALRLLKPSRGFLKERSLDGIEPHMTDARASMRKNFDADDACQQASERRAR
jgi:hypothetical protein